MRRPRKCRATIPPPSIWYSGLRRPKLGGDGGFGLLELRFQAALVSLVKLGSRGDGVADVDQRGGTLLLWSARAVMARGERGGLDIVVV